MLIGFVVRETEKALAFVSAADAATVGVKPMWIPRAKIASATESDARSVTIITAQDGARVGIPMTLDVDAAFLAKIGAA